MTALAADRTGFWRYWLAALAGGAVPLAGVAIRLASIMAAQNRRMAINAATLLHQPPRLDMLPSAARLAAGFAVAGLVFVVPTTLLFAALIRAAERRSAAMRALPGWGLVGLLASLPVALLFLLGFLDRAWFAGMLASGVVAAAVAWAIVRRGER